MFERDPGRNPHKALWQAVLLRAVEDARLREVRNELAAVSRLDRLHLARSAGRGAGYRERHA